MSAETMQPIETRERHVRRYAMNSFSAGVLLGALALVACSSAMQKPDTSTGGTGGDGGIDVPGADVPGAEVDPCSTHSCARACTEAPPDASPDAGTCQTGEVCRNGVCSQPEPAATTYTSCNLDSDCPRTSYCYLKACRQDCVVDRECTAPKVCTSRGQCVDPTTSGGPGTPPPPPPLPAGTVIRAQPSALDFGLLDTKKTLSVTSPNGVMIPFRIVSDRSWLSASPVGGTVDANGVAVTVSVDRSMLGADRTGQLTINSTAGTITVDVAISSDLSGLYSGNVEMTTPSQAAVRSSLHVTLLEGSGGAITGYVDQERSLLYPRRAGISGTRSGNKVTLTFVMAGAAGSSVNPNFPRPIRRTITMTGTSDSNGQLQGTVQDVFKGLFDDRDVTVQGTFRLQRSGDPDGGQAEANPDLTFDTTPSPFGSSAYASCDSQCPPGETCGTDLAAGDAYLKTSVGFYKSFQALAVQLDTDPFAMTAACDGSCLNTVALRCAQYRYAKALASATGSAATDAALHLLDALQVMPDYALLFGNARLASATDAWKTQGSLANELQTARSSIGYFDVGSHTQELATPIAMLDPYMLKLVTTKVPAAALASSSSNIPTLLGDYAYQRSPFEHLRRQLLAVGGGIRSRLETADRQFRMGQTTEALQQARNGSVGAYTDLVILSELFRVGNAPATAVAADITALLKDFNQLSRFFDDLIGGKNVAGYMPAYVPFLFVPDQLPKNNFQQILATAVDTIYRNLAAPDQAAAKGVSREFERDATALTNQIVNQQVEYDRQINEICGTTDLDKCGVTGSAIDQAASELRAAQLRIDLAGQRLDNLSEEIRTEEDRARQVAQVDENLAQFILKTGEMINSLQERQRKKNRFAEIAGSVGSFASAFGQAGAGSVGAASAPASASAAAGVAKLGGWGAAAAIGVSVVASLATSKSNARTEAAINRLRAMQEAEVYFAQARIELINSAALVKSKMLEMTALEIELEIARENAVQVLSTFIGLRKKAELLAAQRARIQAYNNADARRQLQFRLYADDLGVRADESFRLLMQWAYLATRALEYEMNISYGNLANLWQSRSADDVNRYLILLDSYYRLNAPLAPQNTIETISVRDVILDLGTPAKDAVTGATYEPRQRFRAFVADPANRDANGNFHITFMTHRPDKPVFSRNVCNDRIKSVRINLVGDNLGAGVSNAFIRLTHGGTNYLRSCSDVTALVPYDLPSRGNLPRSARVQAGINMPSPANLQPNTDLLYRALLAGPWELVIDQRASYEPTNTKLDISGLDDIELVIEHESFTVQ